MRLFLLSSVGFEKNLWLTTQCFDQYADRHTDQHTDRNVESLTTGSFQNQHY